jgi:hypothetical protein
MKHILWYLRGTIKHGISYVKGSSWDKLIGYTNAAYGNAARLRSTSEYVFILAGGPVSCLNRRQPNTATSSSEAEYIAAADAAKQAIWQHHFLYSIRKQEAYGNQPRPLYIDNTSTVKLSEKPVLHSRSKHILIWYHAIRILLNIKTSS